MKNGIRLSAVLHMDKKYELSEVRIDYNASHNSVNRVTLDRLTGKPEEVKRMINTTRTAAFLGKDQELDHTLGTIDMEICKGAVSCTLPIHILPVQQGEFGVIINSRAATLLGLTPYDQTESPVNVSPNSSDGAESEANESQRRAVGDEGVRPEYNLWRDETL